MRIRYKKTKENKIRKATIFLEGCFSIFLYLGDKKMKNLLQKYMSFLLDLDGTIFRGKEVIPEAPQFIERLKEENKPYLYLTNNSSATPEQLAERLTRMGIEATPQKFFTSAMATAQMIRDLEKEKDPARVSIYVIGEQGLHQALQDQGFTIVDQAPADYVVVGIDRSFTYEKMKQAVRGIYKGARFISTNRDRAIPTEEGLAPGNGSLTAAIAYATGQEPINVGKPEAAMIRLALASINMLEKDTLLIGDNLETDISAGMKSGVDTLLVLTGFSQEQDLVKSSIQPTHIKKDLKV